MTLSLCVCKDATRGDERPETVQPIVEPLIGQRVELDTQANDFGAWACLKTMVAMYASTKKFARLASTSVQGSRLHPMAGSC